MYSVHLGTQLFEYVGNIRLKKHKVKVYLHNSSKYTNFASRINDSPTLR